MSKTQKIDVWPTIEKIARDLGVSDNTLRQWKLRGVPYWAHIPIIKATSGTISSDELMATRK